MFTGLTVATVIGVPLGTFIGQPTSWRVPFLIVAALAAAAAIAIRILVRTRRVSSVERQSAHVDRPALALALATTVVGFGSQFVVFTFLAAFLQGETGLL
jgi:MFS transporter, DHA1 family, inner membrane transport protein